MSSRGCRLCIGFAVAVLGCAGLLLVGVTTVEADSVPEIAFESPTLTHSSVETDTMKAWGTVVADFDADGDDDIAISHQYGETDPVANPHQVVVMLRQDDGTYALGGRYATGGLPSGRLSGGDLEGDGDIDLALGTGAGFAVMRNDGAGAFSSTAVPYIDAWVEHVVFADLDRDGRQELLATGGSQAEVRLFEYDVDTEAFAAGTSWSVGGWPQTIEVGDVNGDGRLDLWVADGSWKGGFHLMRGTATGFTESWVETPGNTYWTNDAALGDVDGDGDTDIIAVHEYATGPTGPLLYENTGNGVLAEPVMVATSAGNLMGSGHIQLSDLDRDGDLDLVGTNGGVTFAANDGTGTFTAPTRVTGETSSQFAVADINRDGLPDVVAVAYEYGGFETYANASIRGMAKSKAPVFAKTTLSTNSMAPFAVEVGDMNGDGHQDIAWIDRSNMYVVTQFGDGSGGFAGGGGTNLDQSGWAGGSAGNPSDFLLRDFTGDGWLDLCVLSWQSNKVSVFKQNIDAGVGNGFFTWIDSEDMEEPRRAVAGDYRYDGALDVVVSGERDANWLHNDGIGRMGTTASMSSGGVDYAFMDVVDWPIAPGGANTRTRRSAGLMVLGPVGTDGFIHQYLWSSGGIWSTSDGTGWSGPLVSADFERDGRPDLGSAPGSAGGTFGVWRAPSDGTVSAASDPLALPSMDVAAGDINNDGCPDAVIAGSAGADFMGPLYPGDAATGQLSILLSNGLTGAALDFAQVATLTCGPGTRDVEIADFNEDGLPDLITADPGGTSTADGLSVFLQTADTQAPAVGSNSRSRYDLSASITVTATDEPGGSGLEALHWELDDSGEHSTSSGSTLVTTLVPGAHSLEYWATDLAGNESAHVEREFVVRYRTTCALTSSSKTVSYGTTVKITGTLKSGSVGIVGRGVKLESSGDGAAWTTAATGYTATGGIFTFSVRPMSKTYYRVRFLGDSVGVPSLSGANQVLPRPSVGTPKAPKTMKKSTYYTVYGYLKPRHTSGTYPVRIYKYRKNSSGKWVSYGYVKAKASNYSTYTKYSKKLRLTKTGKWRLRAYAPADSMHAAKWSSSFDYVTVK